MRRLTLGHDGFRRFGVLPADGLMTETDIKQSGAPAEKQSRQDPKEKRQSGVLPFSLSPDRPLFSLGGRKIYSDDLLLAALIAALRQDKADPSLLGALVYLLASV